MSGDFLTNEKAPLAFMARLQNKTQASLAFQTQNSLIPNNISMLIILPSVIHLKHRDVETV